MISKHILEITFLNKPELGFCTQLNGFKLFKTIQFSLLFTQLVIGLNTFFYTQLNVKTVNLKLFSFA